MLNQVIYTRAIEADIVRHLFEGKIVTIYGPRQVGKTTLVKKLMGKYREKSPFYINCDEGDTQRKFANADTSTKLKQIVGDSKLVVLDEAQRIRDIGIKLKLLVDTYPEQQLIATGSSSFELSQNIIEPLTGRNWEYWLYPLTIREMSNVYNHLELERLLESILLYGLYPSVVSATSLDQKEARLKVIAENYLYKDILTFDRIKNTETIRKLLEALALQTGSEVSYGELGNLIGLNRITVMRYIELLKKAYILFELPPFSKNKRKELGKLRKIYFYDIGIRNALAMNFIPISFRPDIGALWENFIIAEFAKRQNFITNRVPLHFWRTYDQQEIDLVEEREGTLRAFEITWGKARKKPPKAWRDGYPDATWNVITRDNYLNTLLHDV